MNKTLYKRNGVALSVVPNGGRYEWTMCAGDAVHRIVSYSINADAIARAVEHLRGFMANIAGERMHEGDAVALRISIAHTCCGSLELRTVQQNEARLALAAANKSGDGKRRAAAMRALNYFGRQLYATKQAYKAQGLKVAA